MSAFHQTQDGTWDFSRAQDKPAHLCQVLHCTNPAPTGPKAGNVCSKCKTRRWSLNHPEKKLLNKLRGSAARRRIPFSLTLEQFKELIADTPYLQRRGRTADSLSIDRVDPRRGYEWGNVRVLTYGENSSKGWEEIEYRCPEGCPF